MIDELRAALAGQTIWDRGEKSSVRGLHLRVSRNGAKSFYLYYRTREQKQRRFKLGSLGEITLSEARRRAQKLAERVSLGEDPKGEWNEKRGETTVQELFEMAWEGYWSRPRFEKSGWGKEARRLYEKELAPTFGALRLSEVTGVKVRAWHERYEAKPYAGNRALAVFSRMFRFAEEREIRKQHSNPCNLVKDFPERKRKRFASREEIGKIIECIEKHVKTAPAGVAFLYLMIFTGSRPRAIERATWENLKEFEMEGQKYGLLRLDGKSTAKTGQEETVILPPQAMKALSRLPRVEGCTITGIRTPRSLWRVVREEAGCPDLWARDWRRTFATIGNSSGVSMGVIGELLNHRSADTTKIYAKVMEDTRIGSAAAIAQTIENIASLRSTTQ